MMILENYFQCGYLLIAAICVCMYMCMFIELPGGS